LGRGGYRPETLRPNFLLRGRYERGDRLRAEVPSRTAANRNRTFRDLAVYTALGWFYKTAVELVMLPVTYRVIAYIKRHEPTYEAMV